MENPFLKRATEFLRDEEAFLAIVSPEPVKLFLTRPGKRGVLYDRLVFIRGTPGSGKTTLMQETGKRLGKELNIAVLVGDPETERDAVRMREVGINAPVSQESRKGRILK